MRLPAVSWFPRSTHLWMSSPSHPFQHFMDLFYCTKSFLPGLYGGFWASGSKKLSLFMVMHVPKTSFHCGVMSFALMVSHRILHGWAPFYILPLPTFGTFSTAGTAQMILPQAVRDVPWCLPMVHTLTHWTHHSCAHTTSSIFFRRWILDPAFQSISLG